MSNAAWLEGDSCWSLHLDEAQAEILLGRTVEPIPLGECQSTIRGRTVLVTGAGGFIGSELCRTLGKIGARQIVALDASESALAKLIAEWGRTAHAPRIQAELCDVRDLSGLRQIFRGHRPSHVYHAAAYKHVPFLEGLPFAAIENNALATWHVARLAVEASVERFVLISSDKAASAANILGMSKRLAEWFTIAAVSSEPARFTVVRCGNVLGSPGSVLPRFVEQARAGGPVTVCHEAAERYFMTVREAAHAILHAGHITEGDDIFVPVMGAPLRIVELARRIIQAQPEAGREPFIEFTQLRAGDQIKEQLLAAGEQELPSVCRALRRVQPQLRPDINLDSLVAELTSCCRYRNMQMLHDSLDAVMQLRNTGAFSGV